ncbi:MAG: tRNA 2-thiouridine(34) synthase MnmA [Chloracidobacterium sp. CP2_5A]|nr:MAG: tRNA 2-thiouridine(34) synthase MnmA [Chloracidobacterium sp. CP2_5A]
MTERIAVAMSGGVDSSAVAALLAEQGQDIVGFSMQLWNQRRINVDAHGNPLPSRCCSLDDLYDARAVANLLGIPFYVLNFEDDFEARVVRPFVVSYLNGSTPSPCVACNSRMKFDTLVALARDVGATKVATGHYARAQFNDATGRWELLKGRDQRKDQSYFLFELTQEQLACALFPLGELSKAETRAIARRNGLPTAEKAESQEICFIPDGDYARFIERYVAEAGGEVDGLPQSPVTGPLVQLGLRRNLPQPGEIVTTDGRVLGQHAGAHRYTIGQRRGIGVNAGDGRPLYVIGIDAARARVIVGFEEELPGKSLTATRLNWIAREAPTAPLRCAARIRYRHEEAPATVYPLPDGNARVVFDAPQKAITPGQAVVFYDGERVLGGGWILAQS